MGNVIWMPDDTIPKDQRIDYVFNLSQIGNAQFWFDKHECSMMLCRDNAKSRMEAAGITGLRFIQKKTA